VKTHEREKARTLRREEGASVKEIAHRLGVSKSSVSLWVRDIALTDAQTAALRDRNPAYNGQRLGALTRVSQGRARRKAHQEEGRSRVRSRDEGFVRACLLYWGEGAKSRHSLSFSNADVELVRVWMNLLRTTLRAPEERIRITCYLYSDHLSEQCDVEQFWLSVTGLTARNMCRSIVNSYSRSSKRKRQRLLRTGL
jgi:transposase-like protein